MNISLLCLARGSSRGNFQIKVTVKSGTVVYKWATSGKSGELFLARNWCIYAILDTEKSSWLRPYSETSFRQRFSCLASCTMPLVAIMGGEFMKWLLDGTIRDIFKPKIGRWGNVEQNENVWFRGCWCIFVISFDRYICFECFEMLIIIIGQTRIEQQGLICAPGRFCQKTAFPLSPEALSESCAFFKVTFLTFHDCSHVE